jgi:hypothetical protein
MLPLLLVSPLIRGVSAVCQRPLRSCSSILRETLQLCFEQDHDDDSCRSPALRRSFSPCRLLSDVRLDFHTRPAVTKDSVPWMTAYDRRWRGPVRYMVGRGVLGRRRIHSSIERWLDGQPERSELLRKALVPPDLLVKAATKNSLWILSPPEYPWAQYRALAFRTDRRSACSNLSNKEAAVVRATDQARGDVGGV